MTLQLNVEGKLNLTIVTIKLDKHEKRTVTFVTDVPYRIVVGRTLLIIRRWTNEQITREDAIRQLVAVNPHFPVFGDATEIQEYVDCLDGHHIVADFSANEVFMGRNRHDDTWGRAGFGNHTGQINWDGPNGAAELEDKTGLSRV